MRVAPKKIIFFKESFKFLGFIVSSNGAKTGPEKVKLFKNMQYKDIATIARPLSSILKGKNGNVNKHMPKKVAIEFGGTCGTFYHQKISY